MVSLHSKRSRGHKYWYIVESRRVNAKPEPIGLRKADDLSRRLQGLTEGLRIKFYSHGAVAALLDVASRLEISALIKEYSVTCWLHWSGNKLDKKQISRDHWTPSTTLD